MIAAFARRPSGTARCAAIRIRAITERRAAASPEQRREEIAEALELGTALPARRAAKLEAPAEIRRRTKLLPGLPVAPELIVCRALLGVLEHFIGFLHVL